jgi:glycosyltransferase involved in cell wall biosynthesis
MARAYAAAEKVFCVSQKNLELLECQINRSLPNAEVVRNPFNVSPEEPPAWPAEKNVWRVACVARLEPAAKGQDLLLQVLSQAQWRNRPLEVNFYGTGSSKENLERLVHYHKLHNVHFRGHVADVRQIWEQNSLLVLASRYEGLPLALTEAMWCARPAVVTDVGGCAELCEDGTTGFVAAAPTVELLAETLERAWNQRQNWRELGINARAKVEKLVSLDPVADFGNRLLASSRQISDLPKIASAVAC